ncbi:MAG: Rne/Rng family ribonuclease [Rhodobacteraceae bacterium]|nr:Rne/Rng family ribonuclease [Paracoccaceae bacterium]
MPKKMLIDATHAEETRVVVVDGNKVEEFDFESENKRQLAGNIYLAKVTRVEPSLQAAFIDYGGNRHGFLAFSEIHPDYYQIPVADREKLLKEEAEYARAMAEEDAREKPKSKSRSSSRSRKSRAAKDGASSDADEVVSSDVIDVDVIDMDENDTGLVDVPEAPKEAEAADTEQESGTAEATEPASETSDQPAAIEPEGPDATEAEASQEEPEGEDTSDEEVEPEEDDSDDDVRAEIRPRKPRPRRYKIQEVVKVRQILLVQVVKEERGNKGAALTTYLSLAGRYCVLMPNTARGGGISRKITNAADRKKLKEIANEIEVPEGAGLIIRTAGAKRTKTEVKRDYEYLLRQWEQVRDLTLKSIAPSAIYEEGNLIKRSIRDLYNREIDEVFVEGEAGYRIAKDYMKMLMPSHATRVKHYTDGLPLFARYQVENYLDGMFNPVVQLRSGGYIVIGITEALVAIDVNSGKSTKEGSIEDTALRTNLEAAEEVARQLRLRDLAGLIVIDFIDMEERRNNSSVEKRIKDKLKTDRARIQIGRISTFGLMEMSRQRLRPGMLEATTQPCPSCHGTGLVRSDDSLALSILRELEEEGTRKRSREVLITAPVSIANYLLNEKRDHIAMIESRFGMSVRVIADPHLITPEYKLERFKTTTRWVTRSSGTTAVTIDSVEPVVIEEDGAESAPATSEDQPPKKKRRRRRRRSGGKDRNEAAVVAESSDTPAEAENSDSPSDTEAPVATETEPAIADATTEEPPVVEPAMEEPAVEKKSSRSRTTSRSSSKKAEAAEPVEAAVVNDDAPAETLAEPEAEPEKKPASKSRATKSTSKKTTAAKSTSKAKSSTTKKATTKKASTSKKTANKPEDKADEVPAEAEVAAEPQAEPAMAGAEPEAAPAQPAPEPDRPKRSGWWSRAIGK